MGLGSALALVALLTYAGLAEGSLSSEHARASRRARSLDSYTDAAIADHVETLPGWGTVDDANLFAGYVS